MTVIDKAGTNGVRRRVCLAAVPSRRAVVPCRPTSIRAKIRSPTSPSARPRVVPAGARCPRTTRLPRSDDDANTARTDPPARRRHPRRERLRWRRRRRRRCRCHLCRRHERRGVGRRRCGRGGIRCPDARRRRDRPLGDRRGRHPQARPAHLRRELEPAAHRQRQRHVLEPASAAPPDLLRLRRGRRADAEPGLPAVGRGRRGVTDRGPLPAQPRGDLGRRLAGGWRGHARRLAGLQRRGHALQLHHHRGVLRHREHRDGGGGDGRHRHLRERVPRLDADVQHPGRAEGGERRRPRDVQRGLGGASPGLAVRVVHRRRVRRDAEGHDAGAERYLVGGTPRCSSASSGGRSRRTRPPRPSPTARSTPSTSAPTPTPSSGRAASPAPRCAARAVRTSATSRSTRRRGC